MTPPIAPPRAQIPTLSTLELALATERLTLRPLAESDVDAIFAIARDPEFPRFMTWDAHGDRADTVAFVGDTRAELARGTGVTWAVLKDGAFAGQIALTGIQWQMGAWRRDRAEIGYWIAPAHQRQGYAVEATRAVMQFAFEVLGLHKVTIGCLPENEPSRKVIEQSGFRYSHRVDEDVYRHGRWYSHLRYELNVNEWSDVTTTMRFSKPRRI